MPITVARVFCTTISNRASLLHCYECQVIAICAKIGKIHRGGDEFIFAYLLPDHDGVNCDVDDGDNCDDAYDGDDHDVLSAALWALSKPIKGATWGFQIRGSFVKALV